MFYLRGKTPTSKVGDQSNNSFSLGVQSPSEINDAHACGKEDAASGQPARGAATRFASLELWQTLPMKLKRVVRKEA